MQKFFIGYSSSSSSSSEDSDSSRSSRGSYHKRRRSYSRENSARRDEIRRSRSPSVSERSDNIQRYSPPPDRRSRSRSRRSSAESSRRSRSKDAQDTHEIDKAGTSDQSVEKIDDKAPGAPTVDKNHKVPEKNPNTSETPNPEKEKLEELDFDVLEAIGKRLTSDKTHAAPVHKDIEVRWKEIYKDGLPKEAKEEIFKKYSLPENCVFLEAPKLNLEVKASLQEPVVSRDSRLVLKQIKVSVCLSALSSVLHQILKKEEINTIQFIEKISDACKILVDLQRDEGLTRRSLILNNIVASLRETLKETEMDEYLFGKNLNEKLKAAKLIQKSGAELKSSNKTKLNQDSKNSKRPFRQSHRTSKDQRWSQTKPWNGQTKQFRRPQAPAPKPQSSTAKPYQKRT